MFETVIVAARENSFVSKHGNMYSFLLNETCCVSYVLEEIIPDCILV